MPTEEQKAKLTELIHNAEDSLKVAEDEDRLATSAGVDNPENKKNIAEIRKGINRIKRVYQID